MAVYRALALSLTLLAGFVTLPAFAQQDDPALRSAGRKLALDGIALFQQGRAAEASQKLEKAYTLLPVPSVALWSGRALEQRGLLVEASERFVEASRLTGFKGDQDVQLQAQKDAARDLEKLLPRIPSLLIAVTGAAGEPAVTLDGKLVPAALLGEEQPVNPGAHEIKVSLGARQTARQITLKEGEKKRETVSLTAPPDPTSASPAPAGPVLGTADAGTSDAGPGQSGARKTVAYVAVAAGGVGLVLGGVTGVLALSKRGSLEDSGSCKGDVCLPSQRSDVESLDTLRTVSTIGFIAGGVLATTGVVLLLTQPAAAKAELLAPRLALRIAPNGVSLTGVFQ